MSDNENSESERIEDEEIEKLWSKMNQAKVKEVSDEPIRAKSKPVPIPAPAPATTKKARKARGPANPIQLAALAKGREKAKMNAEIKRLEKEQELGKKKKQLEKLKKSKAIDEGVDEEKELLKQQLAELKQQNANKQQPPIVQIMPQPQPAIDPAKEAAREAFQRNLLRYAKF